MRESQSQVQRQCPSHLPVVLNIKGQVRIEETLRQLDVLLSVRVVHTNNRIGKRVAGVQRIATIVCKVDVALDVILRVAIRGPLVIRKLERMTTTHLG